MSGGATTTLARAWAVTRRDGMVLGFTDHDAPLRFEGISFRPDGGLSARAVTQGLGLSVDNTEAQGVLSDDAITEADLRAGRWDAADVRLWEVDWQDTTRRRLIFRGSIGEITRADSAFRAELRGLAEALNMPLGRVYHPRCSAQLADGKCRADLTKPGYRVEAVIGSIQDGVRFTLPDVQGYDQGWFDGGLLTVLTGAAQGLDGAIKQDRQTGSLRVIELWAATGLSPAPGDRVRLTAGCDKRAATCRLKFLNFANFRGFPHLPPEDWLISPQNGSTR